MLLLNWLKRRTGYHVCDEFTRWKKETVVTEKEPDHWQRQANVVRLVKTKRMLWRECTICGRVYQKDLDSSTRLVLVHDEQIRLEEEKMRIIRENKDRCE